MAEENKTEDKTEAKQDNGTEDKKEGKSDELTIDFKSLYQKIKKIPQFFDKSSKFIPVILILIAFFFAIFLRITPAYLPITDEWARNSVDQSVKAGITNQISQQYPILPAENKAALVDKEFSKFIEDNKAEYESQIKIISKQFKDSFQDNNGQTYLIGIDPDLWYRKAENILRYGQVGNDIRDGQLYDTYLLAPQGDYTRSNLHPYFAVYLYKFLSIFSANATLLFAMFYVHVLFCALAVIPAFFITRKVSNNVGGFFAAMIVAVHPFFINRTVAGFSDTDAYSVLFPLLIIWLVIEAFDTDSITKKIILSSAVGFSFAVFGMIWSGWWFLFDLLLMIWLIQLIYYIIPQILAKKSFKQTISDNIKDKSIKNNLLVVGVIILSTAVLVSLFISVKTFVDAPSILVHTAATLKTAAKSTLWPNVYTTVAELNEASIGAVINNLGGKFFLFIGLVGLACLFFATGKNKRYIALMISSLWYLGLVLVYEQLSKIVFLIGIGVPIIFFFVYSLLKKEYYSIFLGATLWVWIEGMLFASTSGIRFIMMIIPAIAITYGVSIGKIYDFVVEAAAKQLSQGKWAVKSVTFAILLLLLIGPITTGYSVSKSEVPTYDDAWARSLTQIKENSSKNAIITSWWDFGHTFKAYADRAVTFDGGTQNRPQAHWVGKVLLTSNEDQAVAILRMLDCGGNYAYDFIEEGNNDTLESVKLVYRLLATDRNSGEKILREHIKDNEKIKKILDAVYCSPPEGFFITSEDMRGKSGVWAHFGSWNFEKAKVWENSKKLSQEKLVNFIMQTLNYSEDEADTASYNIESMGENEANAWIAPWPSYAGTGGCEEKDKKLMCVNTINGQQIIFSINTETFDVVVENSKDKSHPDSVVWADETGFHKKEYDKNKIGLSLAIVKDGDNINNILMNDELAESMFTRLFFFKGVGLSHFDMFHEDRSISTGFTYVWKINWDGKQGGKKSEKTASQVATDQAADQAANKVIIDK